MATDTNTNDMPHIPALTNDDLSAELRILYHTLWTKAVETKDYDKKEWLRLGDLIAEIGVRTKWPLHL